MTSPTADPREQTAERSVAPARNAKSSDRAALYLRVSTREQTAENQERELQQWAGRAGFEVVKVYADTASGSRSDRAALAAVLAGAHRRAFDAPLIWSLDRLSREGIGPMTRYMDQLRGAGVRVMSHQEPWLDTGGPGRGAPDRHLRLGRSAGAAADRRAGARRPSPRPGPGRPVRSEAPPRGSRGAPPPRSRRARGEEDRPGDEGPDLHPSAQVSGLPKVP